MPKIQLLLLMALFSFVTTALAQGGGRYLPQPGETWQWQLSGPVNIGYEVAAYDIDLFDTPRHLIQLLQHRGVKVICYFSAGSYEDWRLDAKEFASSELGKPLDDWAGERWLDIRSKNVRSIMSARLDLARAKGCDAVEPDNMDVYTQKSGFKLTADDQIAYNRFLALQAHTRGLSIGLKNDLLQIEALVDYFDFAVNEQCFKFEECDYLLPFIRQSKAVFNTEYAEEFVKNAAKRAELCQKSQKIGFSTLILPLLLDDSFRLSCQPN